MTENKRKYIIAFLMIFFTVSIVTSCQQTADTTNLNFLQETITTTPFFSPTATIKPSKTVTPSPTTTATYTPSPTATPTPDYSSIGNPNDPFSHPREWIPAGFLAYDASNFDVFQRNMHNREVTIAIEKDVQLSPSQRATIAEFSLNTWGEWWVIFNGFPWNYYTIVIRNNPRRSPAGELGIGWEDDAKHLVVTGDYEQFIGHQIFHAWWGNCVEHASNHRDPRTPEMWSSEGFTQYYGDRAGGSEIFLQYMNEHWFEYQQMVNTNYDVPLIEMGSYAVKTGDNKYGRNAYWKGALVAYMMDLRLFEDGKNLDHLMRYMYDNYCLTRKRYNTEDVLSALEAITDQEWDEFFDSNIYGTQILPLDDNFLYLEH